MTLPACQKAPFANNDDNVQQRAELLLDQYSKEASLYRSRAVLAPLGDDFRWQTEAEAEAQDTNYRKIFDYINENITGGVTIKFGTLSESFKRRGRRLQKICLFSREVSSRIRTLMTTTGRAITPVEC